MQFMTWNPTYSVEVAAIDAQHRHLVGMINGMMEVLSRGSESVEIVALLEDLLEYTRFHFDFEEKLMARAGYTGLDAHREKHAAMKAEVTRLLAEAQSSRTVVAIKLMNFLKSWLSKHIMGTDKEYVPTLRTAGLA